MGLLPQLGIFEIILLTAITLVIVGPKDLPRLLKGVGQFVGQLQNMAAEFKGTVDDVIRESELEEVRREIDQLTALDPHDELNKALTEFDEIGRDIECDLEGEGSYSDGEMEPWDLNDADGSVSKASEDAPATDISSAQCPSPHPAPARHTPTDSAKD